MVFIHMFGRNFLNDGPPTDRGYSAWRGVANITPVSLAAATGYEIYGRGQRFGIGPLGGGKTGWWASANTAARIRQSNSPAT